MPQANPISRMQRALLGALALTSLAGVSPHERLVELDHSILPEASGMAVSTVTEDRLWFINDQGNQPTLIALDIPEFEYTTVAVTGVRNRDWEDLESFELADEHWLAVADIGDNLAKRDEVAIYLIREPQEPVSEVEVHQTLKFQYPGGARDAESLAVDPVSGHIYILSKRDKPPILYRIAMPDLERTGEIAVEVEQLGIVDSIPNPTVIELQLFPRYGQYRNQPTAMTLAPDRQTIALMTYGEAYLARLDEDRDWLKALNSSLCALRSPLLAQPETIAVDGGGRVYLSSERTQAPLIRFNRRCEPSTEPASES